MQARIISKREIWNSRPEAIHSRRESPVLNGRIETYTFVYLKFDLHLFKQNSKFHSQWGIEDFELHFLNLISSDFLSDNLRSARESIMTDYCVDVKQ